MKIKYLRLGSLGLGTILLSSWLIKSEPGKSPDSEKKQFLLTLVEKALEESHYLDEKMDDDFSAKAFDLYMKRLDFSKRFFTKSDVKELSEYRYEIDNQIRDRETYLFDLATGIKEKRQDEIADYIDDILAKPFKFDKKESIELDEEKVDFATNGRELKERWRKALKYQTMTRVLDMEESQEKALEKSDTVTVKSMVEMEVEARGKVLKNHHQWFERLDKLKTEDHFETYVNSFVNVFGPHTSYFAPKEKEDFDIRMSGQLEGIGARLQQKDGEIKVIEIVPGSPSYLQGDLEVEDIILKVAEGDEDPTDLTDMLLNEAVRFIRGKKGTEARLTVRKIDGSTQSIAIIRDVVVNKETYAKSAVVRQDDGQKIGYIKLPKFYSDFGRNGKAGRNCADDVRAELEKLNDEKVDGIVLDLRNNGGGSLYDVVKMTGLFIEKGPIVQVKSPGIEPKIMHDRDSEVVYNGPLVVMVNEFSASASEILAAAIQDYGRGVVVGSTQTFGKGTVQRFIDFDRMLPERYNDVKPLGAIKMTQQKFYRVNGGSTQLKGVYSDIVMPDTYTYIETGEAENDYVMPWDQIPAAKYKKWEAEFDMKTIVNNSKKRIKSNDSFQLIDKTAREMKTQRDITSFSLNYKEHKREREVLNALTDELDVLDEPIDGLEVVNLDIDMGDIKSDTILTRINKDWITALEKDIYLSETVQVIEDMN